MNSLTIVVVPALICWGGGRNAVVLAQQATLVRSPASTQNSLTNSAAGAAAGRSRVFAAPPNARGDAPDPGPLNGMTPKSGGSGMHLPEFFFGPEGPENAFQFVNVDDVYFDDVQVRIQNGQSTGGGTTATATNGRTSNNGGSRTSNSGASTTNRSGASSRGSSTSGSNGNNNIPSGALGATSVRFPPEPEGSRIANGPNLNRPGINPGLVLAPEPPGEITQAEAISNLNYDVHLGGGPMYRPEFYFPRNTPENTFNGVRVEDAPTISGAPPGGTSARASAPQGTTSTAQQQQQQQQQQATQGSAVPQQANNAGGNNGFQSTSAVNNRAQSGGGGPLAPNTQPAQGFNDWRYNNLADMRDVNGGNRKLRRNLRGGK